jgi:hypothetical protein
VKSIIIIIYHPYRHHHHDADLILHATIRSSGTGVSHTSHRQSRAVMLASTFAK